MAVVPTRSLSYTVARQACKYYASVVILRFSDRATKDVFDGTDSKEARSIPKTIWRSARNKLDMLNAAHHLKDLTAARLEKLRADWAGFYSIRVNDQYRIVFSFADGNADEVRIVDYH